MAALYGIAGGGEGQLSAPGLGQGAVELPQAWLGLAASPLGGREAGILRCGIPNGCSVSEEIRGPLRPFSHTYTCGEWALIGMVDQAYGST